MKAGSGNWQHTVALPFGCLACYNLNQGFHVEIKKNNRDNSNTDM